MSQDHERCAELLENAYDLHMHPAPSPFQRAMDDVQLLTAAGKAGMAGILLKSHYESTAARAEMANRYAGSTATAYGAIALNWPVGGLNAYAVHNALRRGARLVFMPTRDAANSLVSGDMPGDFFKRPGISVAEDGRLRPEVYDIMDAVKEYDAVLATGHISPEESLLLCREGRARGVRMVLTHPEFSRTQIPAETQKQLAEQGVFIEKCWYNVAEHEVEAAQMAQTIRTVGAEHCFMTTDRGQGQREAPVEAMRRFIETLMEQGITHSQLNAMLRTVPQKILGL